jgi:hypothetical protein
MIPSAILDSISDSKYQKFTYDSLSNSKYQNMQISKLHLAFQKKKYIKLFPYDLKVGSCAAMIWSGHTWNTLIGAYFFCQGCQRAWPAEKHPWNFLHWKIFTPRGGAVSANGGGSGSTLNFKIRERIRNSK